MKIAPSILSADFAQLKTEIETIDQGGADLIHVDVMDGHFVPNITFGPNIVESIRPHTSLPLDVHLMIEDPEKYIEDFAKAGADIITIHQESTKHVHRALQVIKNHEVKVGISINPGTPVSNILPILPMVDLVLVMSVNPGFGGQSFIKNSLDKISQLDHLREIKQHQYEIEVDGGINLDTAVQCADSGADILVAGSYIFNASNPKDNITEIKRKVKV